MTTLTPLRKEGADDFERGLLEAGSRERPEADARQRMLQAVAVGMTGALAASAAEAASELGAAAPAGAKAAGLPSNWVVAKWVGLGVFAGLGLAVTAAVWRGTGSQSEPLAPAASESAASRPLPKPEPRMELLTPTVPSAISSSQPIATPSRKSAERSPDRVGITEELALLEKARSALAAGDTARASALLAEHSRMKERLLTPEAELLAVELALARGDSARARSLAQSFIDRHPRSPHARRARSLLVSAGGDPEPSPAVSTHRGTEKIR